MQHVSDLLRPERADRDILGMILSILRAVQAAIVVGEPLYDMGTLLMVIQ